MAEEVINTPSSTPEQEAAGLLGLQTVAINKAMQNLDCCLPARIVSYDRITNRATVEPMYKITSTGGATTQMAQIDSIPVLQLGGGGVFINFGLRQGDLGWIIANDQDISLFLQSYESSPGNTKRNHSFSDAFFIPDLMHDYYLSGQDEQTAIQTQQGTTFITLSEGNIDVNVSGIFTYVSDADLRGDKNITVPKDSIAKSGDNYFKLLADVTLDDKGEGKGNFKSVVIGDIPCPENSLVEIVTQIAGWLSVNNENEGEPQGENKGISITDQQITINSPSVFINGPTTITGDLRVNGNITASGNITGDTP